MIKAVHQINHLVYFLRRYLVRGIGALDPAGPWQTLVILFVVLVVAIIVNRIIIITPIVIVVVVPATAAAPAVPVPPISTPHLGNVPLVAGGEGGSAPLLLGLLLEGVSGHVEGGLGHALGLVDGGLVLGVQVVDDVTRAGVHQGGGGAAVAAVAKV